jgi:hypothetical protein
MDQEPREPTADAAAAREAPHRVVGPAFEVRVAGLVSPQVLQQLPDVQISAQEMRTVLVCRCRDQAELHGVLARLRTFGLEVVEVRRLVGAVDEVSREGDHDPE